MSLTTFEGRNFPSVFTDVHTQKEVQAAREEVQKERRARGRMWIWVFVIFGVLVATAAGAAWAYGQYQTQFRRAENLSVQVQNGATQQTEFQAIADKRTQLELVRADLAANIDFIRRRDPTAAQDLLTVAQRAWVDEDRRLAGLAGEPPTYGPLQLPGQSQAWGPARERTIDALDREAAVMQVVAQRVEDRIAIRPPAGGGNLGSVCNPVTGANCRRRN